MADKEIPNKNTESTESSMDLSSLRSEMGDDEYKKLIEKATAKAKEKKRAEAESLNSNIYSDKSVRSEKQSIEPGQNPQLNFIAPEEMNAAVLQEVIGLLSENNSKEIMDELSENNSKINYKDTKSAHDAMEKLM